MARMYGSVQGSRGLTHRLGGRSMRTVAASWQGAVVVRLYVTSSGKGKTLKEVDCARIELTKWNGCGVEAVLYDGPVDNPQVAKLYTRMKYRRAKR